MNRLLLAVLAVLVLPAWLLAGCGDDDTGASEGAGAGDATPSGSLQVEEFCAALSRLQTASQSLALVDSSDREAVRAAWEEAADREEQVAALAPPEVAPAVATLMSAGEEIRALLDASGWDTQLLAGPEVGAVLEDPDLDAAQQRINQYSTENCEP